MYVLQMRCFYIPICISAHYSVSLKSRVQNTVFDGPANAESRSNINDYIFAAPLSPASDSLAQTSALISSPSALSYALHSIPNILPSHLLILLFRGRRLPFSCTMKGVGSLRRRIPDDDKSEFGKEREERERTVKEGSEREGVGMGNERKGKGEERGRKV